MRRLTFALLLAALMIFIGGAAAQDLSVDPSGVTIQYWHQYNSGAQLETMNALVAAFNESNEYGITVEATPQGNYNDLRELINNGIISGDLPNLVAGFASDAISYAQEPGVVVDLEPYFTDATHGFSEDDLADLNLDILNSFVADGARIGYPNQVSANVLSVNLGMLESLGIDTSLPMTVESFRAAACAAAESDLTGAEGAPVQGYPIKIDSSEAESWIAGFGGSIFADGAWDFTGDAVITYFQLMQDLYNAGCAYIPDTPFGNTDDFAFGLNPFGLGSTAGIPFILGNIASSGSGVDNWTVTTTPVLEAGDTPSVQVFVPGIIVLGGTPEENLASWLFLKHLASAESQVAWTTATSYFPTRASVSEQLGDFLEANPYFAAANELVNGGASVYASPQQLSYNAIRGLLATALADVTSGGMDVATVAARLTADANQAMADM